MIDTIQRTPKNPGIVPPWLQKPQPHGDDDPHTWGEQRSVSDVERIMQHAGFVEFVCDELPPRG